MIERTCLHCSAKLMHKRPQARFCSDKHRKLSWIEKNRQNDNKNGCDVV